MRKYQTTTTWELLEVWMGRSWHCAHYDHKQSRSLLVDGTVKISPFFLKNLFEMNLFSNFKSRVGGGGVVF